MRITVFGGNGRVGSRVVAEAIQRGHTVRAFVFATSEHIAPHDQVEIMQGDATDVHSVHKALKDTDIVINCLGSWGTKTKDVQTRAMQAIIPAMKQQKVSRIVSLTGAEAWAATDAIKLKHRVSHALFGVLAGKILADGEDHLRQLEQSNLDWTVLRSPVMTDKGQGDSYRLTQKRPSFVATIRRDSVVAAMLDAAESDSAFRQAPFITRV